MICYNGRRPVNFTFSEYYLILMKLKEIMEELNLFERERVPNDIRILSIAIYIQTSSTRGTAKILSESPIPQFGNG